MGNPVGALVVTWVILFCYATAGTTKDRITQLQFFWPAPVMIDWARHFSFLIRIDQQPGTCLLLDRARRWPISSEATKFRTGPNHRIPYIRQRMCSCSSLVKCNLSRPRRSECLHCVKWTASNDPLRHFSQSLGRCRDIRFHLPCRTNIGASDGTLSCRKFRSLKPGRL